MAVAKIDPRQPGPGRDHLVYHTSGSIVGWYSADEARRVHGKYLALGHDVHIRFPEYEKEAG